MAFGGDRYAVPAAWQIAAGGPIESAMPMGLPGPACCCRIFRTGTRLILADKALAFRTRVRQEIQSSWLIGRRGDRTIQPSGDRVNGNDSISLSDGYTDVPRGKIAAVVTCLEMLARPSPRPDPPHPPWKLRRVVDPDLGWFRDLYRRVGQDWLWFSRLTLADDALAAIIRDRAIELYALEHLGRDEGLLELDFRQVEVCELSFFGVTPGLIGNGAGRWLMNRALEIAWSRSIRRFWVHTCTLDHPLALRFYLRSGFRAFHRQIEIADDPRTLGVLPPIAAPGIPITDR